MKDQFRISYQRGRTRHIVNYLCGSLQTIAKISFANSETLSFLHYQGNQVDVRNAKFEVFVLNKHLNGKKQIPNLIKYKTFIASDNTHLMSLK